MSQETSPNPPEVKAIDEASDEVKSIASDIDFKPYLEAVNTDSHRTRNVIYVLIAALLLIFTAYRNTTSPDWTDARLARLQQAAACVENKLDDDECKVSKKYATDFLFQGSAGEPPREIDLSKESGRELKAQIDVFIRQRTEALSLRLPFFGITIDMNDLGMVCGLLLTAILYVLYASLKSEIDDLDIARNKALRTKGKEGQADNLELMLMAQVLAPPAKWGIGVGQGLYVLFLLVPVPHLLVLRSDLKTYPVAALLQGERWAIIETRIDIAAFALVVVCSLLCVWQQARLNGRLKKLFSKIRELRGEL